MGKKSIKTNAVLNVLKSVLSIAFPLITYPYVFRVLHAENIGKVDYARSVIDYFSFIAALGVTSYAIREGSKKRDDKEAISRFTNEVFSINVASTLLAYLLLIVCLVSIQKLHPHAGLLLLLSLSITFQTLGVDWINIIYEDFLFTTIRSIIIHFISFVLLFLIVKNENDYYWYALLSVLVNAIVAVTNWRYCRKYIELKFTISKGLKKHFIPILMLFVNNIATSIYVNSDSTMLGWMVGDYYVGLYSIAVKIYNVLKNVMASIYSVVIPRISYCIGKNDLYGLKQIYSKLVSGITILLIPASIGVLSVAREIVMFMGGMEYEDSVFTLQILSVSLIGAVFGGLITYCLNIPLKREKENVVATSISAAINLGLNAFLIPLYKQNGAAFTTVISEFFVFIFCLASTKDIRKYIDIHEWKKSIIHSVVGVMIIIMSSLMIHKFLGYSMISMALIVMTSVLGYGMTLILMKDSIIMECVKHGKDKFESKTKKFRD